MMKMKSHPPPGITTDVLKGLDSLSKPKSEPILETQILAGPPHIKLNPSPTSPPVTSSEYPVAHRPVVEAMLSLTDGSLDEKVELRPLHAELRSKGFDKPKYSPPAMVEAAAMAKVIRCFKDEYRRRVAVLEIPGKSRSSAS